MKLLFQKYRYLQLIADEPKLQISMMISVKKCHLKSTDTVNISELLLTNKFQISENFKFL
jgi:hypothetical protein